MALRPRRDVLAGVAIQACVKQRAHGNDLDVTPAARHQIMKLLLALGVGTSFRVVTSCCLNMDVVVSWACSTS
jgi:hypothetical protein